MGEVGGGGEGMERSQCWNKSDSRGRLGMRALSETPVFEDGVLG